MDNATTDEITMERAPSARQPGELPYETYVDGDGAVRGIDVLAGIETTAAGVGLKHRLLRKGEQSLGLRIEVSITCAGHHCTGTLSDIVTEADFPTAVAAVCKHLTDQAAFGVFEGISYSDRQEHWKAVASANKGA